MMVEMWGVSMVDLTVHLLVDTWATKMEKLRARLKAVHLAAPMVERRDCQSDYLTVDLMVRK